MEKNAVLVVSFGTSHLDTLNSCIEATEIESMKLYQVLNFAGRLPQILLSKSWQKGIRLSSIILKKHLKG